MLKGYDFVRVTLMIKPTLTLTIKNPHNDGKVLCNVSRSWIDENNHGISRSWIAFHIGIAAQKIDPLNYFRNVKSVIVVCKDSN